VNDATRVAHILLAAITLASPEMIMTAAGLCRERRNQCLCSTTWHSQHMYTSTPAIQSELSITRLPRQLETLSHRVCVCVRVSEKGQTYLRWLLFIISLTHMKCDTKYRVKLSKLEPVQLLQAGCEVQGRNDGCRRFWEWKEEEERRDEEQTQDREVRVEWTVWGWQLVWALPEA